MPICPVLVRHRDPFRQEQKTTARSQEDQCQITPCYAATRPSHAVVCGVVPVSCGAVPCQSRFVDCT